MDEGALRWQGCIPTMIIPHRIRATFLRPLSTILKPVYALKALFTSMGEESIRRSLGFTLVELMVVMAIISALAGIATPAYMTYLEKARIIRAIAEIRTLDKDIFAYKLGNDKLPGTLGDIGRGTLDDPWGNPYQYLNFANITGTGKMRKDHFKVPLNTDYDLYSMGKDGQTAVPLTAAASHDDIIRANDGRFVGKASDY
jgi:general secretion pathway protein G